MQRQRQERPRKTTLLPFSAGGAAAAWLLLSAGPAGAAVDYFELSPEQLLNAQVISASRMPETVGGSPAAVFVITQEDIARSGMTSIPELLRLAPGVNVAQADSNTWAISIRGFNNISANKLLVLVDGRTVYNPLNSGTHWEIQDMPLTDIERIEVVRGPGGALWGANAVNGVVHIITKNARDTQGGMVTGGYGNYEKGFATGRYGGASDKDLFYRSYLMTTHRDSFKRPGGGDANDSWQSYRGGFRMDWDKSLQDTVTLQGDVYRVDSDALSQSFSLVAPFATTTPETIESRGGNILGSWQHTYDDASTLLLRSYLDYTLRDQELLRDRRFVYDLEGQYNFKALGRHEIVTGGNYRRLEDSLDGSGIVTLNPPEISQDLFGVFAQDRITLKPDRWFLTLGVKLEHNDYIGFEYQPNARLQWTPDDRQTLWAAVSRAVRTPSRIDRDLIITNAVIPPDPLFGPDPTEIAFEENKNIGSEELIAYELGYRKQITPTFALDTAAFVNIYDDLRSLDAGPLVVVNNGVDPIHNFLPLIPVSDMTGEVYGFELAASWEVKENWDLSASYTFLDMYLHAPLIVGTSQDTPEEQSPGHQAGLRSHWNVQDNLTFDTGFYYVSDLDAFDIPAYLRTDVNLGWQVNEDLRFNLVGQNLLDTAHREFSSATSANAAEVPRSVFGKVTWTF